MATYRLNDAKMFADVTDGIAIIINSETGIYYGMNGFGTNVYENLERGVDSDIILSAIKELDGVPANIEENFNNYINALLEHEIIAEASDSSEVANINAQIAKEDGFKLQIKEYSDAQELLLADPIHEVKEDKGWTPEKDSIGYSKEETRVREEKLEKE